MIPPATTHRATSHRAHVSPARRVVALAELVLTVLVQVIVAAGGLLAACTTEAREWCAWHRAEWLTWSPLTRVGVVVAVGTPPACVTGLVALVVLLA